MKIEFEITGKKMYLIYLSNMYTTQVLFKCLINVSKGKEIKFDHYKKKHHVAIFYFQKSYIIFF